MLTTFDLTVGSGHASVHLDVSRSTPQSTHRHVGLMALALVAPVCVLLASAAIASATGKADLDILTRIEVIPPVAVGVALVCPLLAMVLLAAARVRVIVERRDGAWHGRVSLHLARGELAAALVGLSLITLFVAHLFADGYACLNGIRRAC
jgi:hypothetical protein